MSSYPSLPNGRLTVCTTTPGFLSSFFLPSLKKLFYAYECLPTLIYALHVCGLWLRPERGHWIHWNWSYRKLWVTMWVLATKLGSFGRVTITQLFSPFFPLKIFFYYMWMYLSVCMWTMSLQVSLGPEDCSIPWNWTYRWLWVVQCGCCELNLGSLQ